MKKVIFFLSLYFVVLTKVNASFIVMNQDNKQVLFQSNMHEKRLIASITKVLTAHIVLSNIDNLDQEVLVGDEVLKAHGSSIYLNKGEVITIRDLLYGMLLRSGNDAAIVLAKATTGSVDSFVDLMNDEVKKLGLKDSIFYNPTGLDDNVKGNVSTAYDMAVITIEAMKDNRFKKIFKTKHYKCKTNLKSYDWYNKNKTLSMYKYVSGGKTGYTKKAKRTLITTAKKDNINLVIVSLNMADDFNFHVNYYKSIFRDYENYLILNKDNLSVNDNYYKKDNCRFYTLYNYFYLANKDDIKNIHIEYILSKYKKIRSDMIVGLIHVYNNKDIIYDEPLYIKCT